MDINHDGNIDVKTILPEIAKDLPSDFLNHPHFERFVQGAGNLIRENPIVMNWIERIYSSLNSHTRRRFIETFVTSVVMESMPLRMKFFEENGITAPFTVVINPTMRCNLMCEGCYSYKYSRQDMEYKYLQQLLREVRNYGVRFITISGGEPLLYRDLFEMLREFDDMAFMMYTNGLLINESIAKKIAEAGNLFPAISIEGFEKETDERRGKGVFQTTLNAMKILRENGVFFGFSVTPTSRNSDIVSRDEFVDFFIEQGALFGWFFTYIPVGKSPDVNLMATPSQRELLRKKTREWAYSKPIFLGDFFNDGCCTGGCLSASRYCYITVDGYVQPCTFVQFATHNIKEHTFLEVWKSHLFATIRQRQPYSENLLRVCKIIDNPHVLKEVIDESGARPTCDGADEIIHNPVIRRHLERYADEWSRLADEAWRSNEYDSGKNVYIPFVGRRNVYEWFVQLRNRKNN